MEQQNQQPNQQLNQTPIDEQKRKTSKRITVVLLAFAAVLIAVGGILLLKTMQSTPVAQTPPPPAPSPQPQITEGWPTYRNDEFGFEMKYPPSWQFEGFPDINLTYGTILSSNGPQKDRLYIGVGGLNYTGIDNPEIVYQQEVFAGKAATVQSIYKEGKLISRNIEVLLDAGGYITIKTTPNNSGSFSDINQILSTFKFSDQDAGKTE